MVRHSAEAQYLKAHMRRDFERARELAAEADEERAMLLAQAVFLYLAATRFDGVPDDEILAYLKTIDDTAKQSEGFGWDHAWLVEAVKSLNVDLEPPGDIDDNMATVAAFLAAIGPSYDDGELDRVLKTWDLTIDLAGRTADDTSGRRSGL